MTCPYNHLQTCDRCELLALVLADIHYALEEMSDSNLSCDVIEEQAKHLGMESTPSPMC